VWLILSLAVIFGVLAIGLDGGRLMEERRRVQSAADAAALAAAADLYQNFITNQGTDPNGTAQAAALQMATANGYNNDGVRSIVTVNIPPTCGPFKGQSSYVEVIVRSNLQGTFGAAITGSSLTVRCRAVARGRPKNVGILLLDTSASGAFSATGNGNLTVGNTLAINSNNAQALSLSGNATLQAPSVDITGGLNITGGKILGSVSTGMSATADPFRTLPIPQIQDYPVRTYTGGSQVLQPGIYFGGLQIGDNASVTLQPGVYILSGGGLQVSGNGTLTGAGVMLYNASGGTIQLAGTGQVTLSPPTGGAYQGVSLFQESGNTQPIGITGNGNLQLTGVLYAPNATVSITGNGAGDTVGGAIVCKTLSLGGDGSCKVDLRNNRALVPECSLAE
jgi:Flp pilus assembly protein TadG